MSGQRHIVVVDDEPDIGRMIEAYLSAREFRVTIAQSGAELRQVLAGGPVDLVILDLILPGEDGLEIARRLRVDSDIGIIILTGRGKVDDRVVGLELGADDYLTKPFSLRELLARVRSVLRRHEAAAGGRGSGAPSEARFAGWTLDLNARQLAASDGTIVPLTTAEFRLLHALIAAAGKPVHREHLLGAVAEREWTPFDCSIDVLIGKLRQKIEPIPKRPTIIKTERGVGYLFTPEVELS